jgi:single-strand DNA-binding protein
MRVRARVNALDLCGEKVDKRNGIFIILLASLNFFVMIKLQVIGNLGKDCVTREVNGKNVINFNVAHTERYKDSTGVQQERTTWVECAYWTERTGVAPYLKRGTTVYVEGTPEVRTYTTNDGRNGASLTMRVLNLQLVGSKSTEGSAPATATASAPAESSNSFASAAALTDPVDDLPF